MDGKEVETLVHSAKVVAGAKFTTASAAVTGGSGVWAWLGENHQAVTAVCGIGGFCCAIIGVIYTVWHGQQELKQLKERQ